MQSAMEPKETHKKIEELLSAAFDGEVSLEEHAQAEEALDSPEWASHAAFLSILKDSARFEDTIEMPASLSERIALATYAKPTLWSRISTALRPAPMRYAAGGLALSGLAAIGLVMLRPPAVDNLPKGPVLASPSPPQVANVNVDPAPGPDVQQVTPDSTPTPVPQAVLPTPKPELPPAPEIVRTPAPTIRNHKNDVVAPSVTQGTTVAIAERSLNKTVLPDTPKVTPASNNKKTAPSPLAPAKLAEPIASPVPVAMETPRPTAVETGDVKGVTEGTPDIAQPRAVTIASTTPPAAGMGDPGEINPQPKRNPDAVVKFSLNQAREKLNGLTGQAGVASASGSRIPLVTDNEKR